MNYMYAVTIATTVSNYNVILKQNSMYCKQNWQGKLQNDIVNHSSTRC